MVSRSTRSRAFGSLRQTIIRAAFPCGRRMATRQARLVAALGNAHSWPVLREPDFRSAWPAGTNPAEENAKPEAQATFAWSDRNGDGKPQPAEVQFVKTRCRGVTVMNDLSCVVS